MVKQKSELYKKCIKIIGELTPIKSDCGKLCGCACCHGDESTGMLLFPGEETELHTIESANGKIAVCSGSCERGKRPLACRIFPFFPTVAENGRIFAEIDSRAYGICPLAANCDEVLFDDRFIRAVRRCGELLKKDKDCLAFMQSATEDIDACEALYSHK